MNNNFRKIIFLLIFIVTFFINQKADASLFVLKPSSATLGIGEQFYVDVNLDTEGKIINGVDGIINFSSENISFIRAEEGSSMISLWVEKPSVKNNIISFSGIIPNGFSGVIDPFRPNTKLPGLIVRLIFEAKKEGKASIVSSYSYATLNDGMGTIDSIPFTNTSLTVSDILNPYIHKTVNDVTPEINAYVTRDVNLYNNKYVLVFDAKDKQTGIKEVSIKEGRRPWEKNVKSPYLLKDQSRHSIIALQATNYSGSAVSMTIDRIPYKIFSSVNISIVIFLLIVLFFIIKRVHKVRRAHKSYEKNI